MTRTSPPPSPKGAAMPPIDDQVKEVLQRVRGTFAELLTAVGADPMRPQDVSRRLGLNKNLAWKISRVIREKESGAAVAMMPGREGLKIFLHTMHSFGAPADAITSAKNALAEFEQMIDLHSGDRDTLGLMVGGGTGGKDLQRMEALRKQSFRGNSAIWGVQARLQLSVHIVAPSDDPEWADLVWLSGLVDFRRLRGDVIWTMASARKADDAGELIPVGPLRAIDSRFAGPDQAPLLGDFCSDPPPAIRVETTADGLLRYQLVEGPVGKSAATTCIVAVHGKRFVRRLRTVGDTVGEHNARLYTPAELLLHDLLVHRDLTHALRPSALLYSQLPVVPSYPQGGRALGLLPLPEQIADLGAAPPDLVTPELPHYSRMIAAVLGAVGWSLPDFHGFRLAMRYPPMPTVAVMRYDLP